MTNTENFFNKKRSWSIIKDKILDWYLTPYLSKILSTGKPLRIIDCFAGKGRFDDDQPGSPTIIADHIQDQLVKGNRSIKGIFIEKKYFKELNTNMSGFENCGVLEGTYEEHIDNVLSEASNTQANIFLYIDPYGIKSLDIKYFKELTANTFSSFELLMNFNSLGFLREGCRLLAYDTINNNDAEDMYEIDGKNSIEHMNSIAGGDYWQKILPDYNENKIKMFEAEEQFTAEYSKRLKNIFKFSINIPIKQKTSNIPKYRLIFGTNHPDGLLLMADNMNKKWGNILENERGPQLLLFDDYVFPDMTQMKNFNLDEDLLFFIDNDILLKDLLVKMVEKYGISFSLKKYKNKLKEMEKQNIIEIKRVPELTPTGKISTSMEHEGKNYKITIKKK